MPPAIFFLKQFFPFSMSLPYIPGVETRLCNMDDHMYSMSSRPEIALTHRKQFVIAAAFKFGCTNCSLNSCETARNQHFNKTHDLFADSLAKRELLKELNHLQESLSEDDLTNCNKIVFICKKKKSSGKSFMNGQQNMTTEDFSLLLIRKKAPVCADQWASSVPWGWLALQCCIKVLYKVSKFQARTCSSRWVVQSHPFISILSYILLEVCRVIQGYTQQSLFFKILS